MAVPMAPPQSIWLPADLGSARFATRSNSPAPSRGNSLGGDLLVPGLQPPALAVAAGGSLRPRSISPVAGLSSIPTSSVASSMEAPVNMAVAGVDVNRTGRANFIYVGMDKNGDGIPDALQAPTLPPAASAVAGMPPMMVTQVPAETVKVRSEELKLQEASVWFQGQRAPLSALVQDTVTQQFLKIKESMQQEMQRCVKTMTDKSIAAEDLLSRLEAERSARQSTLLGLRHDFDRQQAQISDLVQSRLTTSAVQDQALRDRDQEILVMIQNLRQDIEGVRAQNRNSLAGNVASSDQQQRVEKSCLDLRRDIEAVLTDNRKVQTKTDKSLADLQKAVGEVQKKMKASDAQREKDDKGQQLAEISQHIATQREYQQQVERVVLELRKDLQGVVAGMALQKEQLASCADEQQRAMQEQQKVISELRGGMGGEAAVADLRKEVEGKIAAGLAVKERDQVQVTTLEENLKKCFMLGDRLQRLEREADVTSHHIQELSRVVNTESVARIELTQTLDAYRAAHLQTSSEIRAELAVTQDRVGLLENVQLEDRGLRERTMEQVELNLQELMSVTQLERDARAHAEDASARRGEELAELKRQMHVETTARVDLAQSLEAFRTAHLQTSAEVRKEIEAVSENCGTVRGFMDHYIQEESDARRELSRAFEEYRGDSDGTVAELRSSVVGACERLGRVEADVQESQQMLEDLRAEDAERESARADFLGSSSGLRAEIELATEKLGTLESVCDENDAKQSRAVDHLERGLLELRKLIIEGIGSESVVLRGGLETVNNGLQTVTADVEVERYRRVREASDLSTDIQALRAQLAQLEAASASRESSVAELRSVLVDGTEPALERVANSLSAVAADVEIQKAVRAKESSDAQQGLQAMSEKLQGLESAASEDRGWRQQAVQDLEGILGDIRHLTPAATSTRTLPTLATALRLCKAEQAAD